METKKCGCCKQELSVSDFHKSSREKSGLQQWCKQCRKLHKRDERVVYHRERYHSEKDKYIDYFYKRTYGITLQEYNAILSSQNNVCNICFDACITGRRLAVDHCHLTGKVRGLLCKACNQGIGLFKDDTKILKRAIEYLNDNVN